MFSRLLVLLLTVRSLFKTQHQLALENLALRQQLAMLRQSVKRPRVSWFDRVFWVIFARYVEGKVVALPRVGGLHHHYTRSAA